MKQGLFIISINQSINQYTFNTTVTIARDYNEFKNISANNTLAKDKRNIHRHVYSVFQKK